LEGTAGKAGADGLELEGWTETQVKDQLDGESWNASRKTSPMRVGGRFEAGLESWLETRVEGQQEGKAGRLNRGASQRNAGKQSRKIGGKT